MRQYYTPLLLSGAMFAIAGSASADPSFECSIKTSSQIETSKCVSQVEATVEKVLAATLGFAQASAKELDDVTGRNLSGKALTTSQTAWAAYRDAHCAFVGTTFGGGSGTSIAISSCRIDLARDRISQLMDYVQ